MKKTRMFEETHKKTIPSSSSEGAKDYGLPTPKDHDAAASGESPPLAICSDRAALPSLFKATLWPGKGVHVSPPVVGGRNQESRHRHTPGGLDVRVSAHYPEGVQNLQPDRKAAAVNYLMGYFYALIGHSVFSKPRKLCGGASPITPEQDGMEVSEDQSDAAGRPASGVGSTSNESGGHHGRRNFSNSSTKRSWGNYNNGGTDDDDGDEENDDSDKPRKRVKEEARRTQLKRLACPYFKYDPDCYQDWRSCAGPGWGTTHRLK